MAKYDYGGGCACGLYRECICNGPYPSPTMGPIEPFPRIDNTYTPQINTYSPPVDAIADPTHVPELAKVHTPTPDLTGFNLSGLIKTSPDTNVEAIRKMLLDRSVVGLKKYGVTTSSRTDTDLVGWLVHLQEELLDAAVYIERLKGDVRHLQSLLAPIVNPNSKDKA